jgi:hypothetical protein
MSLIYDIHESSLIFITRHRQAGVDSTSLHPPTLQADPFPPRCSTTPVPAQHNQNVTMCQVFDDCSCSAVMYQTTLPTKSGVYTREKLLLLLLLAGVIATLQQRLILVSEW